MQVTWACCSYFLLGLLVNSCCHTKGNEYLHCILNAGSKFVLFHPIGVWRKHSCLTGNTKKHNCLNELQGGNFAFFSVMKWNDPWLWFSFSDLEQYDRLEICGFLKHLCFKEESINITHEDCDKQWTQSCQYLFVNQSTLYHYCTQGRYTPKYISVNATSLPTPSNWMNGRLHSPMHPHFFVKFVLYEEGSWINMILNLQDDLFFPSLSKFDSKYEHQTVSKSNLGGFIFQTKRLVALLIQMLQNSGAIPSKEVQTYMELEVLSGKYMEREQAMIHRARQIHSVKIHSVKAHHYFIAIMTELISFQGVPQNIEISILEDRNQQKSFDETQGKLESKLGTSENMGTIYWFDDNYVEMKKFSIHPCKQQSWHSKFLYCFCFWETYIKRETRLFFSWGKNYILATIFCSLNLKSYMRFISMKDKHHWMYLIHWCHGMKQATSAIS